MSYKGHLADSGGNGLMYGTATGSGTFYKRRNSEFCYVQKP